MKTKHLIRLLFVVLLLFSCKNREPANVDHLVEIDLDATSSETPSIKEVLYIPLETNDSTLIGDINKIIFRNDCFYIFDESMKVFIFDRNGVRLDVINRVGIGPGEYIMARDMDVDKDGNVYISDIQTRRIIKYTAGRYDDYEIIDVGEYFLDFLVFDDETIYLGDPYKNGIFTTKLARFDNQTKTIEPLRENKVERDKVIPRFADHYFSRSGENIYYYERFSPFLFSIAKDEVHPLYFLKSKNHPPKSVIDSWAADMERITAFEDEYIRDVSYCYEAGDYIRLSVKSILSTATVFNLKNSKIYHFDIINDEQSYGIKWVYASDGEYFVSHFQPEREKIDDILSHHDLIDDETKNKLRGLEEDANPVIVLFNYD